MDGRVVTPEALHDLTDDELTRLANLFWYTESVEASWTTALSGSGVDMGFWQPRLSWLKILFHCPGEIDS